MRSVVSLPIRTDNADPNDISLEDALERIEEEPAPVLAAQDRLAMLSQAEGDLSTAISAEDLTELGMRVVEDYEQDKNDRKEWEDIAREALDACSQEAINEAKNTPWPGAANVKYPLLMSACLQFNARLYPAVIKGDEAVLCKVVGQDNGRPQMAPNPMTGELQPVPQITQGPDGQPMPVIGQDGKMVPMWRVPPGAKAARAKRVSEYLNHVYFYKLPSWEDDTDQMLIQLPAVGCVFRKVWHDGYCEKAATVSALNIYVPKGARNLRSTPRITEAVEGVFWHEILSKMRSGTYRTVDLGIPTDEEAKPRLLLEQHRLIDIDDDGMPEPYIVTVDHETRLVLRVEANYSPDDIEWRGDQAVNIKRRDFYVKYGMFPHPKGDFYDIGLGHLLHKLGAVIDTAINQLLDAGTAQTAGGGFIGSGVRLQSRGNRGVIRLAPGEYKVVDVTGDNLRSNVVERTLPNVSPVTFQVLDLILGAARDLAGAKDVITGEASNTGQVGTTLALIEQGLQVFNATAKRVFRALKAEYTLMYENIGRYGGEKSQREYIEVLDDERANFAEDFSSKDLDIRPVSDPSAVVRMQKLARAQFLMGTIPILQQVGGDPREVLTRVYEAVDAEDIDKLLPPPVSPQMSPEQMAMLQEQMAGAAAKRAKDETAAGLNQARAFETAVEGQRKNWELTRDAIVQGAELGAVDAALSMGGGGI